MGFGCGLLFCMASLRSHRGEPSSSSFVLVLALRCFAQRNPAAPFKSKWDLFSRRAQAVTSAPPIASIEAEPLNRPNGTQRDERDAERVGDSVSSPPPRQGAAGMRTLHAVCAQPPPSLTSSRRCVRQIHSDTETRRGVSAGGGGEWGLWPQPVV